MNTYVYPDLLHSTEWLVRGRSNRLVENFSGLQMEMSAVKENERFEGGIQGRSER